jgi:hypothetical protein
MTCSSDVSCGKVADVLNQNKDDRRKGHVIPLHAGGLTFIQSWHHPEVGSTSRPLVTSLFLHQAAGIDCSSSRK